jgi:hypothetical protein
METQSRVHGRPVDDVKILNEIRGWWLCPPLPPPVISEVATKQVDRLCEGGNGGRIDVD